MIKALQEKDPELHLAVEHRSRASGGNEPEETFGVSAAA